MPVPGRLVRVLPDEASARLRRTTGVAKWCLKTRPTSTSFATGRGGREISRGQLRYERRRKKERMGDALSDLLLSGYIHLVIKVAQKLEREFVRNARLG